MFKGLEGKSAIVTGGYAGLGLETTRTLAAAGAKVVVPARCVWVEWPCAGAVKGSAQSVPAPCLPGWMLLWASPAPPPPAWLQSWAQVHMVL